MEKILDLISGIPIFNGLSESHLQEIKNIAVNKRLNKGELIFSEGDDGNGFFVVVDGQIKIFKLSSEGKEQILHILGAGEPFGQVAMFAGRSFPAYAEAIAKSHLLFFPRHAFIGLISGNPQLGMQMLAVLSMRLRQFTIQIENLSLKEVPGRLASYLIYLADEQEKADEVNLPISKGQLASLLGTIPETLSRIFAKMSSQGLIEVSGGNIRLTDRNGLEELSEHGKPFE
ncbi:MAG: Crp/Fnr family transcriptional regulator [Deltaproteobacteria bacterium]|nr:MAG: Crp/Fnr family transcriptional regulator [Deltaproteobacteria bacterium]